MSAAPVLRVVGRPEDRTAEEPLPPAFLRFIRALAEADEAEDYARSLTSATDDRRSQT